MNRGKKKIFRRTNCFHEKCIIIKVVLHEQHPALTLNARALHHHVERAIFVQVDEHRTPRVRDSRQRLDALDHLAPPTSRTRCRASWDATCAPDGEKETDATLGDQKQVGKAIKISVARARQDGLGGRERRVENVQLRVALQKIADWNADIVLVIRSVVVARSCRPKV